MRSRHAARTLCVWRYATCARENATKRGPFGDALLDVDDTVGAIVGALRAAGAEENTLVLFTSDNGPWMIKGLSGGSVGLLYGSAGLQMSCRCKVYPEISWSF